MMCKATHGFSLAQASSSQVVQGSAIKHKKE